MCFTISKTLLYLIAPPAGLILLILLGLLIAGVCRVLGRLMIAFGILALYLLSISPVTDALLKPLETFAPPVQERRIKADAIVVLGGGVSDPAWAGEPAAPSDEGMSRLVRGIILYKKLHKPLVLMGGNGDPARDVAADAEAMARVCRDLGIPGKDLIIESKSRNTLEGANALTRLIKGKRILLVSSAYHLKRATAMFRKKGFEVVPVPAVYMSEQKKVTFYSYIPHAGNLYASSAACTEYISLFWYTMTRQI
jgi:uncharacterized SAM-binding protein YcdF (DUF218 family)